MKTKICNNCKSTKELSAFGKNYKNIDELHNQCSECRNKYKRKSRKTKNGLILVMFHNQLHKSKARGYVPPLYTKDEFKEWMLSNDTFNILFEKWVESGCNKDLVPSVDRHSDDYLNYDYLPYSFDNIRITTWKENNDKGNSDIRNGINNKLSKTVLQFSKDMIFIAEYYSIREAERKTIAFMPNISACCRGTRKTAGGFIWKFKAP